VFHRWWQFIQWLVSKPREVFKKSIKSGSEIFSAHVTSQSLPVTRTKNFLPRARPANEGTHNPRGLTLNIHTQCNVGMLLSLNQSGAFGNKPDPAACSSLIFEQT